MISIDESFDLKKVINASGKMTILGVSKVSDGVLEAQKQGGQNFFEMSDLFIQTGKYIASLLNVEDAQIVSSASAGIAQSVAGVILRDKEYNVLHPYSKKITKREIIIPKGHNVDYGTPVEVMIQLGGGEVVEAGYANMCSASHVESQINEDTAAILYIKSHHTVQKSMLSITEAIAVAHKHKLPIIIDAAAEEDLFKYTQAGADLVIYSGAKAISGPSSGIVLGKKELVHSVRKQGYGIGRAMKIGKDNILGITEAISEYITNGTEAGESMIKRLTPFVNELNEISDSLQATIVQDGAGRDIYRASLKVTGDKSAKEVVKLLKTGDIAVYTREYLVNKGLIEFDVRAVNNAEMNMIIKKIKEIFN